MIVGNQVLIVLFPNKVVKPKFVVEKFRKSYKSFFLAINV